MNSFTLTIEKSNNGMLWGRTLAEDNLIVDAADSQQELEANMKQLIQQFHQINPATITFEVQYEL